MDRQDILWKRTAVEAAAIVASILMAFAIDAWWDEREERKFERQALISLKAEYQDHREVLTRHRTGYADQLQGIASLMLACQQGYWSSDDHSIDDAIGYLQMPSTTDLGSGVRDSLTSAGRIDVIQNEQLRYELSEWDSVLAELTDNQIFNSNMVASLIHPYLTQQNIPMSATLDETRKIWPTPTRSLSTDPDAMASLFADPRFHSIVEIRYGYLLHASNELDNVISAVDSILARIEDSFGD